MINDINYFINRIIYYFINYLGSKFNTLSGIFNKFIIIPIFKIIYPIYIILYPFLNKINSILLKILTPIYLYLNGLGKLISLLIYRLLFNLIQIIKEKYGNYFLISFLLVMICYFLSLFTISLLFHLRQKSKRFKNKVKKRMISLLKLSSLLIIVITLIIFVYYNETTYEAIAAIFISSFVYVEEFSLISQNQSYLQYCANRYSKKLSDQQKIELSIIKRNCYSSLIIDNIEIFSIVFGEIFVTSINKYLNLAIVFIIIIISFFTFKYIIKSNFKHCQLFILSI